MKYTICCRKEEELFVVKPIEEQKDAIVVKANKLIQEYKYTLTKTELRIVNTIIANIGSQKYDRELNMIEFDICEFCKLLGLQEAGGANYQLLRQTLRNLSNKSSDYINFGKYETIVRWIERPIFEKGSGKVKLKLDDYLTPFLLVSSGAIRAKLRFYFDMDSKYSMRLYELMKSWDGIGKVTYDIDEFRTCIDAMQTSYQNFGIFRTKVLDPSVSEINQVTDLLIAYSPIKTGKKVTQISFTIRKKEDITAVADDPDPQAGQKQNAGYHYDLEDPLGTYAAVLPADFTPKEVRLLSTLAQKHVPYTPGDEAQYHLAIAQFLNEKVQMMMTQKKEVGPDFRYAWLRRAITENWK